MRREELAGMLTWACVRTIHRSELSFATPRTSSWSNAHVGCMYKWVGYLIPKGRHDSGLKRWILSSSEKEFLSCLCDRCWSRM